MTFLFMHVSGNFRLQRENEDIMNQLVYYVVNYRTKNGTYAQNFAPLYNSTTSEKL